MFVLSDRKKLERKTDATIEAFKTERLRWVIGIPQRGPKTDEKKYRSISRKIMQDEMERQMIIGEIKQSGALTIKELSETTKINPKTILGHLIALRKKGVVSETGEKDGGYLYKVV